MKQFKRKKVDFFIKDHGEIEQNDVIKAKYQGKVLHIISSEINDNVVSSINKMLETYDDIEQVVVNRYKYVYSLKELKLLKEISENVNEYNKELNLEFVQGESSFSEQEVENAMRRLYQDVKLINNATVVKSNGEERPFSPAEKLFLIHLIVGSNEYVQNKNTEPDEIRELYAILQKDRKGIVCLGYANYFKALCDMTDPKGKNYRADIVISFTPVARKENLSYREIANDKTIEKYYTERQISKHATNLIRLNDPTYFISGTFHNDTTADNVKYNKNKLSYTHFLFPFAGYCKSEEAKTFIPLQLVHPKISTQAFNLSTVKFVDDAQLIVHQRYIESLKHPKKTILFSQRKKALETLDKQIQSAKRKYLKEGEDFVLDEENPFIEHDYTSWEDAVSKVLEESKLNSEESLLIKRYYNRGGKFPEISSLSDENIKNILKIIKKESFSVAKMKIDKYFHIAQESQRQLSNQMIERLNQIKKEKVESSLNKIIDKLPPIDSLYKEDVDNIVDKIINGNDYDIYNISKVLENNSLTDYQRKIDAYIDECQLTYKDIKENAREEDVEMFNDLIENDTTKDPGRRAISQIINNVYLYLKTLSKEELKNSGIDIKSIEYQENEQV